MTRDDVIRLAHWCDLGRVCGPLDTLLDHEWEDLHRFAELVIKEHTQQVINDPAEIRRVFEIDEADYPPPDSGFAKL